MTAMTKMTKKILKKKKLSKKNFTKKSIRNYQKINNKLSGNRPTDPPTDKVTYRVAQHATKNAPRRLKAEKQKRDQTGDGWFDKQRDGHTLLQSRFVATKNPSFRTRSNIIKSSKFEPYTIYIYTIYIYTIYMACGAVPFKKCRLIPSFEHNNGKKKSYKFQCPCGELILLIKVIIFF